MKNKLVFVFLALFILICPFITSEEISLDEKYDLNSLLNEKSRVNDFLRDEEVIIPSPINSLFKNGNVFFKIFMNNGNSQNFYVVIKDNRIMEIVDGFPDRSHYVISSDEETLNEIIDSEDIPKEALSAYKNGKITIKANGFSNKIKLFFGKIVLKFVK